MPEVLQQMLNYVIEMCIRDRAINQLVKNKTVVVIAHNLSAIRTVDKVLVLDEGQLLEEGDPSSLLQKKGLYSKLWGMSEKVSRWNAT